MLRLATILTCCLLLLGWTATAQVSDGFDYDASGSIAGNGAAGDGWAGGWTAVSDADTSAIRAGGLLNETLLARTVTNRATVISTVAQNRFQRELASPLTSADGEFWFSAHMGLEGTVAGNVGTISFVDLADGSERVTFGKRFGNRNVFATGQGAGATNTGRQFQGNDARWVVGHMVYNEAEGNWQLDVWVDPSPAATPMEADAQITNKPYADATFGAVRIKSEGSVGLIYNVDDIFVGGSFDEVVPDDLVTVPALPGPVVDNLNYGTDSLGGGSGGSGWAGDWTVVSAMDVALGEGGVTSEALQRQTSGEAAVANNNVRIVRRLEPGYNVPGRSFWVSYWFQTENPAGNVSHFVLANADALGAAGPNGRLFQIGSGFNNPNIAVVGGGPQSGTGLSSLTGRFVVMEVVITPDGPDEAYIHIDPSLDEVPSRADANAVGLRDLSNWNAIALLQDGAAGVTATWDDIRLGQAYADVVPDDLTDTSVPQTAIAFDQFNYAAGEDLLGQGAATDGWAGAWDTIASDTIVAKVDVGGLINENLLARTSTNAYRGTSVGENNRVIRYLDTPLELTDDSEVWFSAHLAVNGNVGNNVGTMIFADTTADNYERIIIGKRFGNRNLFATGPGAGPTNSGAQFQGASARYVVGKLTASDTSDNWVLNLWVDPDPTMEPDTNDAGVRNKLYPPATFNAISLKTEGQSGLNFEVDDIFLGTTFADVVPGDLTPVDTLPEPAMEPFDYMAGDSLNGLNGGSGWDGGWVLTGPDNPVITEGGIQSLPLLKQTSGNKVTVQDRTRAMRKMAGTYGDQGRSHWVGWFFDSENGGPNVTNLVLADSERFPDGGAGELLQIGRSFNGSVLRLIGQGQTTVTADEGHFIVLELATDGTAANDVVYMWVDPDPETAPSRDDALVVGQANLTTWDAVALKVAGDPGVTAEWDDIYVGNTYQDIVPNDLLDVQAPDVPVVAYEPFDYTAGEDLANQDGGDGWGGPWSMTEGSITIGDGSIDSDRVTGTGNRAVVNQAGDAVTYTRPYFARFAADSPERSTVWLSYLLDVSTNDIGNSGGLAILDGDTPVLSVGATTGIGNFAVTYGDNVIVPSTTESAAGVNWVVVKLDLYGSGVADTARVWINPLADVLPDDANASFTITDLAVENGFDAVRISASGAQTLNLAADELYTGFSFRDVSPGFGSDDPDLLAYEPFNYPAGEPLFGQGGVNAFWDGVWMDGGDFGANNELTIQEGSVDYDGLDEIGNRAEFGYFEPSTTIRADRDLAFPMSADGRTYWLTFLMNTTEGAAMDNVANVTFRSSGIAQNGGQRLSVGRQFGDGKLGFVTPPSGNSRRSEIDDEGMHWLVFRVITVDDPATPDSVAMWIDPSLEEEPDTSTAFGVGLTTVFKAAPIDQIRIRAEGSGANQTPYVTNFDEIRLATAWRSARLATGVIEPAEDDVFQLTAFPNPFGEELTVRFQAKTPGRYDLQLFDLQGRQVRTLFSGDVGVGERSVSFRNDDLANGFYFLRVVHGNVSTVRKLILYR